jgi:hypothetical protein
LLHKLIAELLLFTGASLDLEEGETVENEELFELQTTWKFSGREKGKPS